ncbi:tyrosine-type recombinase/integrase [Nocardioides sp. SOB44]|uniref:Tyrosine-type recombinase/integrase n=1 Tax=Nocardioides cremeus TaxID=3058044 RepID=A0ABT8TVH9_9ACTN|nr:tyrosine-type recombinase/integrase [Nocardioides cremeus]MDO3397970.1 tyrosine-type recombinase/integrase [Nocardioides cremeus]
MAHVTKAPNGKGWECRWSYDEPDPANPGETRRKFQKQRFTRKLDAEAKRREIDDRKAQGLAVDHNAGKETVEAWANRWFVDYERTVSPNTARKCRGLLDATVVPRLGHRRIRDLGPSDVAEWLRYIEDNRLGRGGQPISPATIKHHYLVLSNVLQYAAQNRAISQNPAKGVRLPTNKSRGRAAHEYVFLTPRQVSELAAEFVYPYDLLVTFLAFTGLRVGECAGLNMADVDLAARRVHVRRTRAKVKGGWETGTPKSDKTRTAPLPRALARDLAGYVQQHPHADDPQAPFWPGRSITGRSRYGNTSAIDYDQPWSPGPFFRNIFKPTVRATPGIPDALRQHDLRHTFASICASNGIPAAQVAAWMGHGNEVVTRTIYTHLFAEDTATHEAALDAAFGRRAGDNVVPIIKGA